MPSALRQTSHPTQHPHLSARHILVALCRHGRGEQAQHQELIARNRAVNKDRDKCQREGIFVNAGFSWAESAGQQVSPADQHYSRPHAPVRVLYYPCGHRGCWHRVCYMDMMSLPLRASHGCGGAPEYDAAAAAAIDAIEMRPVRPIFCWLVMAGLLAVLVPLAQDR